MIELKEHVCICKEGCLLNSNQKTVSVYGKAGTKYSVENSKGKIVSKFIVDDCVLVTLKNEEKCDYLFLVDNLKNKDGYFVELKGGDVPKAIRQIISSVEKLKKNITGILAGRIICSRFSKAPETYGSNPYKKLRKILNGNIEIKIKQYSDII
jgi:hypothetical protein